MAWYDPIADPEGHADLVVHVTGDVPAGLVIGTLHKLVRQAGADAVELWIDSGIVGACTADQLDDEVADSYRLGEGENDPPLPIPQPTELIAFECPNCGSKVYTFSRELSRCLRHGSQRVQMREVGR